MLVYISNIVRLMFILRLTLKWSTWHLKGNVDEACSPLKKFPQSSLSTVLLFIQTILNFKLCVFFFFWSFAINYIDLSLPPSPSRQLILIIELYSHYDVYDYLRQIALTLCSDKVSEVRWISYKLVSSQQMAWFLSFCWWGNTWWGGTAACARCFNQ